MNLESIISTLSKRYKFNKTDCLELFDKSLYKVVKKCAKHYNFDVDEAMDVVESNFVNEDRNEVKVTQMFSNIINEEYHKEVSKSKWDDTKYKHINDLKCNNTGIVGELFIHNVCNMCDIENKYDGYKNKNSTDGTYDIRIKDKRVEIKLARQGNHTSTFQHESLRNYKGYKGDNGGCGCDYYMFIDVSYDEKSTIYCTIIPVFDLTKCCECLNTKPHARKGTTDVFKFDLSIKNLKRGVRSGCTIELNDGSNVETVGKFINDNIS